MFKGSSAQVRCDEVSADSQMLPMETPITEFDKGNITRFLCWAGLLLSTIVGIEFLVVGFRIPAPEDQISYHGRIKALIPLVINIIITLCTESLGLIHATSLKWALFHEGRLDFNANLRLFTATRRSWANSRTINVLYLFALALCYAASSSFLTVFPVRGFDSYGGHSATAISKGASLCLGTSLLLICLICFWSIMTTRFLTWNSNPLTVLAAAQKSGRFVRRLRRCMLSVHQNAMDSEPAKPMRIQRSAYTAHHQVFRVLWALNITTIGLIVWTIAIIMVNLRLGGYHYTAVSSPHADWSIVPKLSGEEYILNNDGTGTSDGGTPSVTVNLFYAEYPELVIFQQILFALLIQSFLTIGTHCAELQINIARDESTWRTITSAKGLEARRSGLSLVLASWQSMILLIFKPLIHWVYGLAMFTSFVGIYMLVPQILYLTILWSIFVAYVFYVSLRKPKGPLPATYGHLQTLADLVDEWSPKMYWGHKRDGEEDGVCHAGTSTRPLPLVDMDCEYMGY